MIVLEKQKDFITLDRVLELMEMYRPSPESPEADRCKNELSASYRAYMDAGERDIQNHAQRLNRALDENKADADPWSRHAPESPNVAYTARIIRNESMTGNVTMDHSEQQQAAREHADTVRAWLDKVASAIQAADALPRTKEQTDAITAMWKAIREDGPTRAQDQISMASAACRRHIGACRAMADALMDAGASRERARRACGLDAWNSAEWYGVLENIGAILSDSERNDRAMHPFIPELPDLVRKVSYWAPVGGSGMPAH